MPKLETQQFRSFERGIIQGVDHLLAPKQSVYFAVNVEFDKKIGSGIVRAGSADVGAAIASDALGLCLGLHSFITSADVVHLVLAINDGPSATNSDVYRLNSGTWTITDNINLTKDIKHRFVTFLDTCAVSNGTDAVKTSTDGTTWVSTGGVLNVANMPKFNTMIEWQDRIYGVKNNDDRLIFSSAAAPTMNYDNEAGGPFTVGETITGGTSSATAVISKLVDNGASGHLVLTDVKDTNGIHGTGVFTNNETITGGTSGATGKPDQTDFIGVWWDQTSGAGFIEIEPDDGGGTITALSKVPGYLIIFKERSMKRWNGVSTFPDDLVNIGTPTQESVCLARNTVFFFNERGIYETNGGYPVLRSRPVQDIIDQVSASYYTSVSMFSDKDNVYCSIGDITLDTIAYTNCILRYNLDTQQWTMFSYKYEPRVWSNYISSSSEVTIYGDDAGRVQQISTGTQDDGADIMFVIQSQELQFSDTVQEISRIIVHTRNGKDAKVYVRVDAEGGFTQIGQIKDDNHEFKDLQFRGTVFEIRLSGNSTTSFEFKGITFPEINTTLDYK